MKVARPALPDLDSFQTAQPRIFPSAEVLSHIAPSRPAPKLLSTVDAGNACTRIVECSFHNESEARFQRRMFQVYTHAKSRLNSWYMRAIRLQGRELETLQNHSYAHVLMLMMSSPGWFKQWSNCHYGDKVSECVFKPTNQWVMSQVVLFLSFIHLFLWLFIINLILLLNTSFSSLFIFF